MGSKLKINHGDCTTTYTFANDKMAFEGKGTAVNDNDWKVDIYAGGEVKQVKEEWKISGGIDAAGKDLGGAKLNVNLPIESNQKNEITLKPKVNLEVADEINLGVAYELSDQTELSASGSWGKDYEVGMEVEHKVDKNWTISASQSFSSERVGASAN